DAEIGGLAARGGAAVEVRGRPAVALPGGADAGGGPDAGARLDGRHGEVAVRLRRGGRPFPARHAGRGDVGRDHPPARRGDGGRAAAGPVYGGEVGDGELGGSVPVEARRDKPGGSPWSMIGTSRRPYPRGLLPPHP